MGEPRLTRAELASRTGISKPTVGESMRRLVSAGVVVDTGERTTGRGRAGSYYALARTIGSALAVSIAPEGISAELIDAHGAVLARSTTVIPRPARPARVAAALVKVCRRVQTATAPPTRLAVVSAADPVDRETGRLVHLPDAPFRLGNLSPVDVLSPFVDGPITVDNDVNWAAHAERAAADPGTLDDFVYLYLGEGLGCAVVSDGDVRRGHHGLAGEIAHLITTGPDGRACPLTDVFQQLGLRRPASTAIDVAALTAAVDGTGRRALKVRAALGQAVAGALSAAVALTDPATIVIGGSWGTHPTVFDAVTAHSAYLARRSALRPAALATGGALTGARAHALTQLRQSIIDYRHTLLDITDIG